MRYSQETPRCCDSAVYCPWIKFKVDNIDFYLDGLYHPPKPIYQVNDFVQFFELSVDSISSLSQNCTVVVAGDVNQLSDNCFTDLGSVRITGGGGGGGEGGGLNPPSYFVDSPSYFKYWTPGGVEKTPPITRNTFGVTNPNFFRNFIFIVHQITTAF